MENSVKYKKFILPIVVGLLIWALTPLKPDSLDTQAWYMFAIFVATIIACITQPMPIGAVSIIGFTLTVLVGVVDIKTAVQGFGNTSIWLIAMAFFISRGFVKTGLGRRIALQFVKLFGKKTLGLAYSLVGVDLILAPATPSNTARAGGIMFPIIKSLSESFGSTPKDGTERKMGAFLIFTEFQGNLITAAMFLTAMAGNPLAQNLAEKTAHVHITWMNWFLAALVPGLVSLIVVPFIIYKMYPPTVKETPNAKNWAENELAKMGSVSLAEKFMAAIFVIALVLWMIGSFINLDATLTAFIALGLLLLTGVLTWKDVLNETGAWNTLVWFSVLVLMADQLNQLGFIPWLSKVIAQSLHGLSWPIVIVLLILFFFYSHYLFASSTAHVSAMYAALLGVAVAAGAPPLFSALILGFFGNLMASTTHYSSGPAPILFGSGYITQKRWWTMNIVLGFVYFIIWIGLGSLWMKVLGIF
ncbi:MULTISPECIES: anion permease [Staphylococcus]|uniref:Divalent anion:Na+ symporter, DASS family n=2 Tax=Staphylococcus TaxID=1279 RepID=A0ABY1H798_9STAP|nr:MULTISPECIES: anion permease [Staphylococcus]KKI55585.1 2-oxoglutarate/malate translocator [Staphylococcus pasteuri]MBM6506061.1 anion permease [Staphylococcus pasteuri]MCE3022103.1 anion permease [Staphylococcus pasteuri]MCF7599792.1 anion permease [Staphylococcus pasteuri]MCT1926876.1 anion permease [Staphylococcus pasteuri]